MPDSSVIVETKSTSTRDRPFGRPMIGDAERSAVDGVLRQPVLTHGPLVKQFEADFADFTGAPNAVATSSCTAALHLAYWSLGLEPGDEVLVPALSHVATAHAVEYLGGRCVFIDAEAETGNVDLDAVEAAITPRTRVISVVHFLGRPVDMSRIRAISDRHGLFVVEDCALALGATFDGTHVGLHGDAGCFSFYPIKHITTGEGGMLIARRDDVARPASMQRAFGIDRNIVTERPRPGDYDVLLLGNNYRLTEIAAAIGIEQMKRLPDFVARRVANRRALVAALEGTDEVTTLKGDDDESVSSPYCLNIMLSGDLPTKREAMVASLKAAGVGTSVYYPRPIPSLSFYRERYAIADSTFPVAERISASLALPVGPHLDVEDMAFIADAVRDAIATVR